MSGLAILVLYLISSISSSCAQFDINECGKTVSCLRNTQGCSPTDPTCLIFSYSLDSEANSFILEMRGGIGNGSQYNLVGFSSDGSLDSSDVYLCTGSKLITGVIRSGERAPVLDSNLPLYITDPFAESVDGVAECSFLREINVIKQINGSGVEKSFDLLSSNYYIIQAYGTFADGEALEIGEKVWTSSIPLNFSKLITTFISPATSMTTTTSEEPTKTSPYTHSTSLATNLSTTPSPSTPAQNIASSTTFATTLAQAPTTTENLITGNTTTFKEVADPTVDCNSRSKGCYFHPPNCKPGSDSCMFASWTYNVVGRTFDFEIIGSRGTSKGYAAIAFAESNLMENADLYYCTETAVYSGVLRTRHAIPIILNLKGLSNLRNGATNGAIACTFSRKRSISKEISLGKIVDFDLSQKKYFLLYATGAILKGGNMLPHTSKDRSSSPAAIDFMRSGSGRIFGTRNILHLQGLLLLVGWILQKQ